jgi:hypothetical protein
MHQSCRLIETLSVSSRVRLYSDASLEMSGSEEDAANPDELRPRKEASNVVSVKVYELRKISDVNRQ